MILVKIYRHKDNLYKIFFENEIFLVVSSDTIIKYNLSKNLEINQKTFELLNLASIKDILRHSALNYALLMPKTKKEIYNYIKRKVFSNKIVALENDLKKITDEILKEFESLNLINDNTYKNNYLKKAINSKKAKSIHAISHDLQKKGIKTTKDEYKIFETKEIENCKKLALFKYEKLQKALFSSDNHCYKDLGISTPYANKDNNRQKKYQIYQKLFLYLSQKGFSYETISSVVDSIVHQI